MPIQKWKHVQTCGHDGLKALEPALDHEQLKELGMFILENTHLFELDGARNFIKTGIRHVLPLSKEKC